MIREIMEIGLAMMLVLPVSLICAQAGSQAQQSQQISVSELEVIDRLDERIRLDRSVMEFAEEFSLFDDQLYGSLKNKDEQRERIAELNGEINTTSDRLEQAQYTLLNGSESLVGNTPQDLIRSEQEIRDEVDLLESKLSTMMERVNELAVQSLFPGVNVVLEISRWDDPLASGATRDILEVLEKSLESARDRDVSGSGAQDK